MYGSEIIVCDKIFNVFSMRRNSSTFLRLCINLRYLSMEPFSTRKINVNVTFITTFIFIFLSIQYIQPPQSPTSHASPYQLDHTLYNFTFGTTTINNTFLMFLVSSHTARILCKELHQTAITHNSNLLFITEPISCTSLESPYI